MGKSTRKFGEMPFDEIEQWEKKTNSLVLFDNEKGIAFQNAKDNEGDPVLVLIIENDDSKEENIFVLFDEDIKRLTGFLLKNVKPVFHDLMGSVN